MSTVCAHESELLVQRVAVRLRSGRPVAESAEGRHASVLMHDVDGRRSWESRWSNDELADVIPRRRGLRVHGDILDARVRDVDPEPAAHDEYPDGKCCEQNHQCCQQTDRTVVVRQRFGSEVNYLPYESGEHEEAE